MHPKTDGWTRAPNTSPQSVQGTATEHRAIALPSLALVPCPALFLVLVNRLILALTKAYLVVALGGRVSTRQPLSCSTRPTCGLFVVAPDFYANVLIPISTGPSNSSSVLPHHPAAIHAASRPRDSRTRHGFYHTLDTT